MNLENFNREPITAEQFNLLPTQCGADIWVSQCTNQWIGDHSGILVLSVIEEIFIDDDKEWRCLPMQQFILTPKTK
jgi:hypothetical protein